MRHPKSIKNKILGKSAYWIETFEGIHVYTVENIKGAAAIPPRGIYIDKNLWNGISSNSKIKLKQHEFGHFLQYRKYGSFVYWSFIAPISLISVTGLTGDHSKSWVEKNANTLAHQYFGNNSLLSGKDFPIQKDS